MLALSPAYRTRVYRAVFVRSTLLFGMPGYCLSRYLSVVSFPHIPIYPKSPSIICKESRIRQFNKSPLARDVSPPRELPPPPPPAPMFGAKARPPPVAPKMMTLGGGGGLMANNNNMPYRDGKVSATYLASAGWYKATNGWINGAHNQFVPHERVLDDRSTDTLLVHAFTNGASPTGAHALSYESVASTSFGVTNQSQPSPRVTYAPGDHQRRVSPRRSEYNDYDPRRQRDYERTEYWPHMQHVRHPSKPNTYRGAVRVCVTTVCSHLFPVLHFSHLCMPLIL